MDSFAPYILANTYSSGSAVPFLFLAAFPLLILIICIVVIVASWKLFEKAGQPGWAAIIPIYNVIVLLQIIRKPLWWIVLFFIPFVNIVIQFIVAYELAKAFGKDIWFAIGIFLLNFIFIPILGFGDAKYVLATEPAPATPPMTPPAAPTPTV